MNRVGYRSRLRAVAFLLQDVGTHAFSLTRRLLFMIKYRSRLRAVALLLHPVSTRAFSPTRR